MACSGGRVDEAVDEAVEWRAAAADEKKKKTDEATTKRAAADNPQWESRSLEGHRVPLRDRDAQQGIFTARQGRRSHSKDADVL